MIVARTYFVIRQVDSGLEDVADEELAWMGQPSATVAYGIGLCWDRLLNLSPDEIKQMVMAKLADQAAKNKAAG